MTTPPVSPQSPADSAPQAHRAPAGYPAPAAYAAPGSAAPASAARGNPYGLASIVVGAVLLLSLLLQMILQAAALGGTGDALSIIGVAGNLVQGILSIVAVALGVVGLTRRGRPQALAGVGTGIGVALLVSTIVWALLYPAALSLFL
ncbi:hypothetical protein [Microbacterium lushaniae]|uniref:Uncharacterized protein n=1 Tax=Microbacterium lushaniae TaxID=2614639 RepID=A0A5J6L7D1_9MICO|nr:hypothetical protein [Microbacterium lushaniae]QEW04609.1 hypothetical protein F6J85_16965 [Microbacterium lushaniae]